MVQRYRTIFLMQKWKPQSDVQRRWFSPRNPAFEYTHSKSWKTDPKWFTESTNSFHLDWTSHIDWTFQYPHLTTPKLAPISEFFGELQWSNKPMSNRAFSRLSLSETRSTNKTNGHVSLDTSNGLPEESFSIPGEDREEEGEESQGEAEEDEEGDIDENQVPATVSATSVLRRQRQWSIDASGVPHFLCILSKKNCLLFACDKFGCIDLYQLDSQSPGNNPRHLRQFELFPGNSTSQKPQIIEAFTVYTPFIVVSARNVTFALSLCLITSRFPFRFERSNWYKFGVFLRSSWNSTGGYMLTEFSRSTIISRPWFPMFMGRRSTSAFG